MEKALELLTTYWGFDSFRKPQEEVVHTLFNKKDAFVLLPTGAGKSLCYQLPALMSEGVCLVISPLIALMEDQVKSLEKMGIKALMLSSKLNRADTIQAFDNLMYGNFKFLYLSPEKLQSEFVQEKIGQLSLNLIAVDEAHCISQWGHEFRPAYLKITILNDMHPEVPKIALTATATPAVIKDILENLALRDPVIFKGSYLRKNLHINIKRQENIRGGILSLVKDNKEPMIIYVGTRKSTVHYQRFLMSHQIRALVYHGGLTNEEKSRALSEWTEERCLVMIATNAFGMGIDKSNVRVIIHAHLPGSIENFMQEIGRAGRDGRKAETHLLYNDNSLYESKELLNQSMVNAEFCKKVYGKLNDHFQIANGETREELLSLDIQDFAFRYQFGLTRVYHVLNHLHNENIIYFDQNPNRSSRIRIIENNQNLYQIQSADNDRGKTLQLLLRTYAGILDQHTAINETLLAKKLNISVNQLILSLKRLHDDKVIQYNPSSANIKIMFLVPREDHYIFHQISRHIDMRNKTKAAKLKAVHHLVQDEQVCRQKQLLAYFGEILDHDCGHCDVCRKKKDIGHPDYEHLGTLILDLLQGVEAMDINEISSKLTMDKKLIVKTLELLLERKSIDLNLQNKFYLKT